ncbi:glycosyltransferase family 2 protein [Paracoccus sp. (in: a-proteobacteria)]|uniref:glycosyltransferase family 2 protein n=1 Tax=Paracoccus sp. TaxID=267 RepID=UPI00396CD34D
MTDVSEASARKYPHCLIIIPCLNESGHIGGLLGQLLEEAREIGCSIFVVDGGSTDGTQAIVEGVRRSEPLVYLVHNPLRLQSAGVNQVLAAHGDGCEYFIRIDAHGSYPRDYCRDLLAEAERTGVESVVVSMHTAGRSLFQRAVAFAQNSPLGTGGSHHRLGASGRFVDHGHHALMRVDAFRAASGYDERFSHNEDAELDYRLRRHGSRIWLTDRTRMTYFPRSTATNLFRQYVNYGRGRARNVAKHRTIPKLRQLVPLSVAPAVGLAFIAPLLGSLIGWAAAAPFMVWALACLAYSIVAGLRTGKVEALLAGFAAMIMHLGWSTGFWLQIADVRSWRA